MTATEDKKIAQAQANLPLPEQPPKPSDWQSADASKTGSGNGTISGNIGTNEYSSVGLREPAVADPNSDMSNVGREAKDNVGREAKDNVGGPPKDAAAR